MFRDKLKTFFFKLIGLSEFTAPYAAVTCCTGCYVTFRPLGGGVGSFLEARAPAEFFFFNCFGLES